VAAEALRRIGLLYAVEQGAADGKLRRKRRHEQAKPLLADFAPGCVPRSAVSLPRHGQGHRLRA
jgi:hypothetical protein